MLMDIKVFLILFLILHLTAAKALNSSDNNTASTTTPDDGDDDESECVLSEMPPKPGSMCCGVDATSLDGIVGGSPALLKQYPWLAWIEAENIRSEKSKFVCGGSLISGLYVLTAAHCVEEEKHTRLSNVYLGAYNWRHTGPDCIEENGEEICFKAVKIAIERIIRHEDYDNKTMYNDIALIKLAKMAPYTEFVRPICLPMLDLNMAAHKNVWLSVAGWGSIKDSGSYQIYPDIKRHVELPFVPLERCVLEPDVTSTQICAGGKKGEDSCYGDSGGPLMYNNDGVYELVGVVSYGGDKLCAVKNVPGIYTNVHLYHDWIMNIIQNYIYMEELTKD